MSNTIALEACPFCGCKMPADGGHEKDCFFALRDAGITGPALLKAWNTRAAIAALEAQPQPSAQGPEEIFLQLHGDCLPHETDLPVVYTDDSVTWCWHRINDSDVRYIRADLAANPKD